MAKVIYYSDELQHHGILGQKWGIRRYQNPDGSLTTEGRIRYRDDGTKRSASERKALQKEYNSQKKAKTKAEAAKLLAEQKSQKKISEMSDEELAAYLSRKRNEKEAYKLNQDIAEMNPKQISAGEKMVKAFIEKAVIPALQNTLQNAGKQFIDKMTKQPETEEQQKKKESERLKQEAFDWQNKANIEFNKNRYNQALAEREKKGG